MKNKYNYSLLLILNILVSIILLLFIFDQSKKSDQLINDLKRIEKKIDEKLVPSTRIKKEKNKRKRKDWKKNNY